MGLETEGLGPELGLLLCSVASTRDRVGSQVAKTEALRVRSELILLPLSMFSPHSWQQHLLSQKVAMLEQEVLTEAPSMGHGMCWDHPSTPVRVPDRSWSATPMSTSKAALTPFRFRCSAGYEPSLSPPSMHFPW